ncbi:MAG: discoidin domain-containing protein [Spirochaetes bacterium]|nr:discoidin domain-containing protein [Spirochaetota bacterium]
MKKFEKYLILFLAVSLIIFISSTTNTKNAVVKIIDNFDSLHGWETLCEGIKINNDNGVEKKCIILNYDLTGKQEWVVISKKFNDLRLPKNYKFSFYIKGDGDSNNLEFKFIDTKGNVFWKKWEYFEFSKKWELIEFTKSDISFAWGPNPNVKLSKIENIEIVISRGLGGKGKVYIDELNIQTLSEKEKRKIPKIKAKASSVQEEGFEGKFAIDKNGQTRWSSRFEDPQWLEIDLDEIKELVGLTLHWETAYGKIYDILLSIDGTDWEKVYSTGDGDGAIDDIYFKKSKARYIKILGKERGTGWGYSLWEVTIKNPDEKPVITASSTLDKYLPANILDGDKITKWKSESSEEQWINIDLRKIKTFGGLFLLWDKDYAKSYNIYTSIDGKKWKNVYFTKKGNGGSDKIYFNRISAKFIKISLKKSVNKSGYCLNDITIKGPGEFLTTQKYYEVLAEDSPAGYFPMWVYKKQAFWTIVGVSKDSKESLLCEDGSIEPYSVNFSIMPFLYQNNGLITWADVKLSQSLEKDYLPIPSVKWQHKDVDMNITLFAYGKPGASITYARYRIMNKGKKTIKGKLFLTIRPFQINPPWQPGGGLTNIRSINFDDEKIKINNTYKIFPLTKPQNFGAVSYKEGDIVCFIEKGKVPDKKNITDKNSYASGVIEFKYNIGAGKYKDVFLAMPLHRKKPSLSMDMKKSQIKKEFEEMIEKTVSFWESKVNNIEINIPNPSIANTLKSNIAYILINRDASAIQPGSRQYERSWIRDGSMTSAALLRTGNFEIVRKFVNWYKHFITPDGMVPASFRSDDPLDSGPGSGIEWDGQGEFIYAVMEYYRFTKDKEFLKKHFDNIHLALKYLVKLRSRTLVPNYMKKEFNSDRFVGILPKSFSHEGYYPEMHSYWDDFWALKGWNDGMDSAKIVDREDLLPWMQKEEKEFRESVYNSIKLTMEEKEIDYIPGCAEKGDFDPTSTSIAIMVCEELEHLPQPQLNNTFDQYYDDLSKRFVPNWVGAFTPYEIRSAQAYIYMNQKKRALELLYFILDCRRPSKWNHLAEVVYSNPRLGQYIGDMPHTWVGSGYINAVRSMFVYEKNDSLILGAGIDEQWLEKEEEISIKRFPTYYGRINYSMKKQGNNLKIKVSGDAKPEKGFVFFSPFLEKKIKSVKINDKTLKAFSNHEVFFEQLPVEIIINY